MGTEYRNEYKYLLSDTDALVLRNRIQNLIPLDSHSGNDGYYLIRSLYFDDQQNSCYYQGEDGVDYRNKYRIRYYNNDTSRIILEKKSKTHGMTKKVSVRISEEECRLFMKGEYGGNANDLVIDLKNRCYKPKVIVSYRRRAYIYTLGNVRITFDYDLTSSNMVENFLHPEKLSERPIFPIGSSLLEVKWDGFMPEFIKSVLDINSIQWTSFSKYYLCRKYNNQGGIMI